MKAVSLRALERHVAAVHACRECPRMASAPVSGGPVAGRVMVVGQAPGAREPVLGRPFAWTAGRTLFRWFERATGWGEAEVRDRFYFAAVCRCFPGKTQAGGDRVPAPDEIARCARWLDAELQLLRPALVVPVGKLAIGQFLEPRPLVEVIGRTFPGERAGVAFELLPLPHPSGASPWHRIEPGKSLLDGALALLADRVARAG